MVNIEEFGLSKPGETMVIVAHYARVKTRVVELVNENEHEKLKAVYHRESGKELTSSHKIDLKHLKNAVKELVNKNGAENAIKTLLDIKISPDIGLSSQMDDVKRIVGKFLPDEVQLDDKIVTDQSSTEHVLTHRAKDLVSLIYIIGNLPPTMEGTYKGVVRELLTPCLKNLCGFVKKS